MNKNTTRITVTIPTELYQILKHLSNEMALPLSAVVNLIIRHSFNTTVANSKIQEED